jgi:RNA polymerase sigma-70 factor, ECF subfamily
MAPADESDLIERFKKGDSTAFEELVRAYQDRVYNLCRYMLRDPRDGQDAAQDVFLKVYRALGSFTPDSSLSTWIYRIAVNTCLDYRRKSRREILKHKSLAEVSRSAEPFSPQTHESRDAAETIQQALAQLREKSRAVIVLREIQGLSYEEIARVLHTSVSAVRSRISRAREELRRILRKKL